MPYQDHPADLSPQELTRLVNAKRFAALVENGLEPSWSLRKLLDSDVTDSWLIEDCLADHQPGVIAGASKSLKTTLATAMALSLASGVPFLGKFKIPERCRVMFCSAESGKSVTKKAIIGMAQAMGIDLEDLAESGMLEVSWWVPRASDDDIVDYFLSMVCGHEAKVVILDPTYKSLDDNSTSLILTGQQLDKINNAITRAGSTAVFVDHVKRSSNNAHNNKPLSLEDISGAGKAEFFRQWMLVGRREDFEASKPHKLWISIGGSAGHSSLWGLDVHEVNPDIKTRQYTFERLKTVKEIDEGIKLDQLSREELARLAITEHYAGDYGKFVVKSALTDLFAMRKCDKPKFIATLVEEGFLEFKAASVVLNGRTFDGYRLIEPEPVLEVDSDLEDIFGSPVNDS